MTLFNVAMYSFIFIGIIICIVRIIKGKYFAIDYSITILLIIIFGLCFIFIIYYNIG